MKSFSPYSDTTRTNIVNKNFSVVFFYYYTLFSFSETNFKCMHTYTNGANELEVMRE